MFVFIPSECYSQFRKDCNIHFDENKIHYNYNLDFFLNKLKTDSFTLSQDRKQIPSFIKGKLDCLLGDMANKGEDWQQTDVIFDETLPLHLLQFFLINKSNDVFIIVYRNGGIGEYTVILMMHLTDKGVIIDHQKNVDDAWYSDSFFTGTTIQELTEHLTRKND
ncbi:hypothetical protein GCM10023092_27750 [Rurimicrobium arvi]|uniref:Uncharacterized protein n=2 Tax=Rurimicrobium arvi TaxID=2049916 RepID=A0ABP8N2P7_9BACT